MSTAQEDPRHDPRWQLVRAVSRTAVPTPPGLVDRVLRSVRGARGGLGEPLEYDQEGGRLRVSERALVVLARRLGWEIAQELGGVHLSAVALESGQLQVLTTVRYGIAADEIADRLRQRLHTALTAELGGPVPALNVHVVDVHPR